jgi:hypothetical protein
MARSRSLHLLHTRIFAAALGLIWWLVITTSNTASETAYSPGRTYAARTSTFVPFLGSGTTWVELYSKHGFKKELPYSGLEQSVGQPDLTWIDDRTLIIKFDPTSNEDHICGNTEYVRIICQPK